MDANGRWTAADRGALLGCALTALLLAVLPHLTMLARRGTSEFLTDTNDVAYTLISRSPYYGGPLQDAYTRPEWGTSPALGPAAASDPFLKPGARIPSPYSWVQFVPLARLTRLLDLPLIKIGLVWRVVGGPLLGAALFFLFRSLLARTSLPWAWALGASLICLADAGFSWDPPLLLNALNLRNVWMGKSWLIPFHQLSQYRAVSPILNLPFLLGLSALLVPRRAPSFGVVAGGAALLGLCLLTYFYTWTAALAGLGLYLGMLLLARAHQRARCLAFIIAGGIALGSPQILASLKTSRAYSGPGLNTILPRLAKGLRIPAGHPHRRDYLAQFYLIGEMALGAAAVRRYRSPGLALALCLAGAAYALANSALVTGLEFENDHWLGVVGRPFGEVLLLSSVILFLDEKAIRPRALWVVPGAVLLSGLFWRSYQASSSSWARDLSRTLDGLRPLRPSIEGLGADCVLAGPPEVAVAVLLGRCTPLYERPDMFSSLISVDQINERHALNAWLSGVVAKDYPALSEADRTDAFLRYYLKEDRFLPPEESWAVNGPKRASLFKGLLDGGLPEIMAKYAPNALLLPESAADPVRGGPWKPAARTDLWCLWIKERS